LLGSFFITEGAIPFAAKDPKRVIPSLIAGSMVVGLLVGIFKIGVSAPHGGLVVVSLFKSYLFSSNGAQIGMGIVLTIATLLAGALTTAFILGF
jgi:PTS system fructose-specific IIC component